MQPYELMALTWPWFQLSSARYFDTKPLARKLRVRAAYGFVGSVRLFVCDLVKPFLVTWSKQRTVL